MFGKVLGSTIGDINSKTCSCSSCECTGSGSQGNTQSHQSAASQNATVKGNSK